MIRRALDFPYRGADRLQVRTCWRAVASAWDSVFVSPLR